MKHAHFLSLLLFCPLAAAQSAEQAPAASTAAPAPQYSSNNAELKAGLADLKNKAESGDVSAAAQVYARYARHGQREQAEAWYHRYVQLREAQANKGDIAAARELGLLYLRGDIYLAPNPQKAVALLSAATELGTQPRPSYWASISKHIARRKAKTFTPVHTSCTKPL